MDAQNTMSGLVPEIYYDLIARVAAGVPLVLIAISQDITPIGATNLNLSNWTVFMLVLGVGYLVGHFLTTISTAINGVICWPALVLVKKLNLLHYDFRSLAPWQVIRGVYQQIDLVASKDGSGGTVLKKMEASCALTDNLFSGWLLLLVYGEFVGSIKVLCNLGPWHVIMISSFLVISMWLRRMILFARLEGFLSRLGIAESVNRSEQSK